MAKKNMRTVEELSKGDMFLLPHWYTGEKRLYMKLDPFDSIEEYTYNAVCLADGRIYDVRDDCEVELVQVNFTY